MLGLLVTLTIAQTPPGVICDQSNPTHCSAPIQKGQPSLLEGQVLTTDLAIFLGQKAAEADSRLRLELDRVSKNHKIDLNLAKKEAEIDLHACTSSASVQKHRADILEAQLEEAESGPSWYASPPALFGYGVATTLLILALVVVETNKLPGF